MSEFRVLVVEDIKETLETYVLALKLEGYRVYGAVNSSEAIKILDKISFHVALVDISLAGKNMPADRAGVDVLRHIQKLNEGTRPIVITSNANPTSVRDYLKEYEVWDYIDKLKGSRVNGDLRDLLLEFVKKAVVSSDISDAPDWAEFAYSVLCKDEEKFLFDMMTQNGAKVSFALLQKLLLDFSARYWPIKKQINIERTFSWDESKSVATARVWSKGQGISINVYIGESDKIAEIEASSGSDTDFVRSKGKAGIIVIADKTNSREMFN